MAADDITQPVQFDSFQRTPASPQAPVGPASASADPQRTEGADAGATSSKPAKPQTHAERLLAVERREKELEERARQLADKEATLDPQFKARRALEENEREAEQFVNANEAKYPLLVGFGAQSTVAKYQAEIYRRTGRILDHGAVADVIEKRFRDLADTADRARRPRTAATDRERYSRALEAMERAIAARRTK